jgi:hypothetical protein
MQISATIKDGTANLAFTTVSTSSNMEIKGADDLADDLEQFLTDPDAEAIDRHYLIVPDDTGLSIQTGQGKFVIPWQHIMTVVNGLRAA